jgi:hypothetical protein
MKNTKNIGSVALVCAFVFGLGLQAKAITITNQGQVITITKMSEVADAGTVTKDQSVWATPSDRRGLHVVRYALSGSTTGTVDVTTDQLPKGSILLEDAVIEVSQALSPTSTAALAIGGITVVAAGTDLNSTGIKTAVATPGITTAADSLALTISGAISTGGTFTVYIPYLMGNAQ